MLEPQGPRLRPLLRLGWHVRAVREIRREPRRAARRRHARRIHRGTAGSEVALHRSGRGRRPCGHPLHPDDLYAKLHSLGPALMLENKLAQATGECASGSKRSQTRIQDQVRRLRNHCSTPACAVPFQPRPIPGRTVSRSAVADIPNAAARDSSGGATASMCGKTRCGKLARLWSLRGDLVDRAIARQLRRILKRIGDGALAETPQRGLLGQFQIPTICVGQSHLFRCATIRFEHHR